MDTPFKRLCTVCRWVIGIATLSLLFGGITVFSAYAFDKTPASTPRHQSSSSDGAKSTSPTWKVVSSPNVGVHNILNAVAVVSANNVWAVGNHFNSSGFDQTLIEQWNGNKWSVVSSPDVGLADSLSAVTAVSANDVWAVGNSFMSSNGSFHNHTLIEHWDGTSWSIVSSPNAGTGDNFLDGVTAVSANDIWAVGQVNNKGISKTLIEHWKGTQWRLVTSPSIGTRYNHLFGVAVVSANDVWAVGAYDNSSSVNQTLIEQWNGSSWKVVSSPNIGTNNNSFNRVAVVSANNVWAVGGYANDLGMSQTLTEQWNGTSWNVVSSPNSGAGDTLTGVAIVSASDIWAVGYIFDTSGAQKTLTEQWNGISWSVVSSPNVTAHNFLSGVAVISANNVWAVGYISDTSSTRTLIEHFN